MNLILLLIAHSENRRLLAQLLSQHYQIILFSPEKGLEEHFDLCIVDGVALNEYRTHLQARINQEKPVFLPVLLLTTQQQAKRVTAGLWQIVDDLLIMPVEKIELLARIATLLRSRQLSIELKKARQELNTSQQELRQLKEELDKLNQLFPDI
ncbi:response regulator [Gloeothece verrucosa]|uniref:Response regulator receiver protein n=1 Tax=Gloeothece verrucosa (strain PCC 7822) TaxID=497965 RepID=E0UGE2_GLOV7|nr:response regulator receiver protein [Gloeothece verrucosa]ADN16761.1 response regulator receiver protein [Gloeothece verrucosa PCC 7822]